MMAHRRPRALTQFDPTHAAQCMHIRIPHTHVVHRTQRAVAGPTDNQ